MRRNDEVEAQRSRWTFYETIMIDCLAKSRGNDGFVKSSLAKAGLRREAPNRVRRNDEVEAQSHSERNS